tara:strand:+ start:7181 stop:7657 length:477 start_codon:yes stop_codon:yes gene_type:complete
MDFTLVPICSEVDHEMEYIHKSGKCDICRKNNISYCCINCEYSRCSRCHRDILAEQEIKSRLIHERIKNNIKLAEGRLKEDGLCDWDVMVVDGEICYINKLLRTYSYDYPKSKTPELSPELVTEKILIPESLPTPIPENYNHIRCTFTEIYNTIKSYF